MNTGSLHKGLLVGTSLLLLALLLWFLLPKPRAVVYSLYRDHGRSQTLAHLEGYRMKSSERFEAYYTEDDRNVVDMILRTAEAVYDPVTEQLGHLPKRRVPLIIYPSRTVLRQAFGWQNGESAMGVYYEGTIRLLSPNVWIDADEDEEQQRVFRKMNPIAHELTHYVLDHMTNGNYPRWFTEGVAQLLEYRSSGFLWLEDESTLRQDLYSLEELQNHFDTLSNQPLAYRQSYLLVEYLVKEYGEDALSDVVAHLTDGVSFARAVERATGTELFTLYREWQDWIEANLEELEAAS